VGFAYIHRKTVPEIIFLEFNHNGRGGYNEKRKTRHSGDQGNNGFLFVRG
jgi:hypothetical protein